MSQGNEKAGQEQASLTGEQALKAVEIMKGMNGSEASLPGAELQQEHAAMWMADSRPLLAEIAALSARLEACTQKNLEPASPGAGAPTEPLFCLQCGPEGLCARCQNAMDSEITALRSQVASLKEGLEQIQSWSVPRKHKGAALEYINAIATNRLAALQEVLLSRFSSLVGALQRFADMEIVDCRVCDGSGKANPHDACRNCGGVGKEVIGMFPEDIKAARAALQEGK